MSDFLVFVRAALRRFLGLMPPRPRALSVLTVEEKHVLRYTINLPAAPAIDDLAQREASIVIDGGTPSVIQAQPADPSFSFLVERDKFVAITLVDVDSSGNRSAASAVLNFTSQDTVPPPQPGVMTVADVTQE